MQAQTQKAPLAARKEINREKRRQTSHLITTKFTFVTNGQFRVQIADSLKKGSGFIDLEVKLQCGLILQYPGEISNEWKFS